MEDNIVIYHHGVKGQKWGVRRFQNKDGSLTKLGKKRLNQNEKDQLKKQKEADKIKKKAASAEAAKKKAEEAAAKKKAAEEAAKKKAEEAAAKKKAAEEAAAKQRAEDLAKKKTDVVKARSAKEFYENRKLFNYDETVAMRKLLQEDKLIKSYVDEEPNKVKKFLTEAADYTKKIDEVIKPATSIIKNVKEIYGVLNGDKPKPTQNNKDKPKKDKPEEDKPEKDKPEKDKPEKDKPEYKQKPPEKTQDTIDIDNDVDFSPYVRDYTPSSSTVVTYTSLLSTGRSAASTADSIALGMSTLAGLLPAPRDDD